MNRTLKAILLGLGGLVALFFLVGLFLPKHTHIERSVLIDAPVAEVYPLVNDLPSWERWSPWHAMEPTAEWTFSSPASGTGAWYTWRGEEIGAGKMTIDEAVANRRIDASMEFEGMGGAEADFTFESPTPAQTKVTWAFDSDHDSIFSRYFGILTDRMLGPSYEEGLAKLKAVAEG